jgi:hypothetical protein
MKVNAKIRFNYGKKVFYPGDEIEMTDKDAKLLAAAGRITLDAPAAADSSKASQKRAGGAGAAAKRGAKAETSGDARSARNAPVESTGEADTGDGTKDEANEAKTGAAKKARGGYKRRDVRATGERGPDDASDTGDE